MFADRLPGSATTERGDHAAPARGRHPGSPGGASERHARPAVGRPGGSCDADGERGPESPGERAALMRGYWPGALAANEETRREKEKSGGRSGIWEASG